MWALVILNSLKLLSKFYIRPTYGADVFFSSRPVAITQPDGDATPPQKSALKPRIQLHQSG